MASSNEIRLAVTGRKTGREHTVPVWFVDDDDRLYVVPIHGSDSDWYKNVVKTPRVRVEVNGTGATATATPVADQGTLSAVVQRLREKYGDGQVESHFSKLDAAAELRLT